MTQKELEQEIKRKEDEIKALLELKDLVFDYERQIDLRLADLSKGKFSIEVQKFEGFQAL